MPEPIEYQIVLNLQTALRGISVANGYHHDVAALAVKLDPNESVETLVSGASALRPFLVLELTPDQFTYTPAEQLRLVMPFSIHAVHDGDVETDESRLRTYLRLSADVEQAMAQDVTRGGLATDTVIRTREFASVPDGTLVWAICRGEILVHRTYGAPNG